MENVDMGMIVLIIVGLLIVGVSIWSRRAIKKLQDARDEEKEEE